MSDAENSELIAGRRWRSRTSSARQVYPPPRLGRRRPRNDFPNLNTNVLLLQRYGKTGLDAHVMREQRELLGSAPRDEQNDSV